MNPSPFETHYFDYITYYEPDGLSLQAYCQEKGTPYDEMSAYNLFNAYFCCKVLEGPFANFK